MPRNQISRLRGGGGGGGGGIGASAAPPKAMQGCKDPCNVGTKMASADNYLK